MALSPTEDRLVVQADEDKEVTTDSGIFVAAIAVHGPQEGVVLAVGPGKYENGAINPVEILIGDRVLFNRYGSTEVTDNGKKLLIVQAQDVLAVRDS